MELIINGETFPLRFGYGFLKEINGGSRIQQSGINLNMGVANVVTGLQTGDVESLIDTLKKANKTETPRLTDEKIEHIFDSNDADYLFEQVLEELKKSQFTKTATNTIMEESERQQEKQNK